MPESLQTDLLRGIQENNHQSIRFSGNWPEHMANRKIKWQQEDFGFMSNGMITEALDNILNKNKDKQILIVANRIDTAQKLAGLLKERPKFATLIHSRFMVKDREEKEKTVCESFGKDKSKRKSGIIVSTQVCEVGLDISCDILITECASADALMQRAGRTARWGGNGEVIIIRPMVSEDWISDGQWSDAFPYVDRKKEGASEFNGIKEGEFAGIAWEYLKQKAPDNLFTNWDAMTDFCNAMNYCTDDVEARGALGQLFESTLYADERPWNLSARGDLYCTLAVVSGAILAKSGASESTEKKTVKSKKKKAQEAQIVYKELKQYCINVPFRYLVNKDTKKLKQYDFAEGKVGDELNKARVKPFQTYIIDSSGHYEPDTGLIILPKEKANETEEASCLII
jgi:CRISPR-associated endonuclease/helicase Cas3